MMPGFLTKKETIRLSNRFYNESQRFCYKQANTPKVLNLTEISLSAIGEIQEQVKGESINFIDGLLGLISGGGWFYNTPLFLGYYEANLSEDYDYDMPLALLVIYVIGGSFILLALTFKILNLFTSDEHDEIFNQKKNEKLKNQETKKQRESILSILSLGHEAKRMSSVAASRHGSVAQRQNSSDQSKNGAETRSPETEKSHQFNSLNYFNILYTSWNYNRPPTFQIKTIKQMFMARRNEELRYQKFLEKTKSNIYSFKIKLWSIRILVNLLILAIFAFAVWLLEFATHHFETHQPQQSDFINSILALVPSITITGLNFCIPKICQILLVFENYSSSIVEMNLNLFRFISIRSITLIVYFVTVRRKATKFDVCQLDNSFNQFCNFCENIPCWETFFGQTFYRVVVVGILAQMFYYLVVTFMIQYFKIKYKDDKVMKALAKLRVSQESAESLSAEDLDLRRAF